MNVTFVTPHFMVGDDVLAVLNSPCILRHPTGSEDGSVLPVTAALRGASGGAIITYAGQGWKVEDRIECVGEGEFLCERTWCNESGQSEQIVLSSSIDRPGNNLSYLIPAVSYNGNGWGRGQEPKGLYDSADAEQGAVGVWRRSLQRAGMYYQ